MFLITVLAEKFLPTVKYVHSDYMFDNQANSTRWFQVSSRQTAVVLYQVLTDSWFHMKPCTAVWAVVALWVQVLVST